MNIPGATASTYTTNQAGNYSVVISQGTAFAQSAPTTLAISKAAPKITPIGSLDICATGSVILKGKIGVGSTYQWYKNGVVIAGAPLNLTVTTIGSYKLKETTAAGCVKSKTASVTSSCKLDESNNDDFVIYPNPNNGDFSIQLSNNTGTAKEINITIYSATGAVVYESNYTSENSVINEDINLGNAIASGMYLVKITNGTTTLNKTLVIE